MQPKMTVLQMRDFLTTEFPEVDTRYQVRDLPPMGAIIAKLPDARDLRPGGTLSGAAIFELADITFYVATLAMIGPKALTVTTSAAIDYMRKPAEGGMWAEARILKLGKTLSVGDVMLYSDAHDRPVAHANITFSIPPRGQGVG
ncbi:MAG: PaaI family thioesterase [Rhodobacteraceae bacterium]|nr:PaaI family thioesterase [Paracoccaceae bacterium]